MRTKVWVILFLVLVLAVLLFVALAVFTAKNAEAPQPVVPGTTFKGPTGQPYVKGPTGPPPGE